MKSLNRMSPEEHDLLVELMSGDGWTLFLDCVDQMSNEIQREIIEGEEDQLVRLRGQVDGAQKLQAYIKDFKEYIKEKGQDDG